METRTIVRVICGLIGIVCAYYAFKVLSVSSEMDALMNFKINQLNTSALGQAAVGIVERQRAAMKSELDSQLWLWGIGAAVFFAIALFGGKKESTQSDVSDRSKSSNTSTESSIVSDTSAKADSKSWHQERNLSADNYQRYLVETYEIKKNDVLNKFIVQDATYETLEQALAAAEKIDLDVENKQRQRDTVVANGRIGPRNMFSYELRGDGSVRIRHSSGLDKTFDSMEAAEAYFKE